MIIGENTMLKNLIIKCGDGTALNCDKIVNVNLGELENEIGFRLTKEQIEIIAGQLDCFNKSANNYDPVWVTIPVSENQRDKVDAYQDSKFEFEGWVCDVEIPRPICEKCDSD